MPARTGPPLGRPYAPGRGVTSLVQATFSDTVMGWPTRHPTSGRATHRCPIPLPSRSSARGAPTSSPAGGMTSTVETVHGLLRPENDELKIQWRLAKEDRAHGLRNARGPRGTACAPDRGSAERSLRSDRSPPVAVARLAHEAPPGTDCIRPGRILRNSRVVTA